MRRFALSAAAAAALVATMPALVVTLGDAPSIAALRHLGPAVSAAAAVLACGWLSSRSAGRLRSAWALLAISAAVAALAELADAGYAVWSGPRPGLPSISEVGVSLAMPVAMAGLLLYPPDQHHYALRRRALLDSAMIALSLVYIGSALSLPQLFARFASPSASWIGPASLAVDFALLTVISLTLRRSQATLRPRLLFVLGGLAVIAIADCASVFLAATGGPAALREVVGSGSMCGFAAIALAALWPQPVGEAVEEDIPLWPDLIPYLGVGAVAVTAVVISIEHQAMTGYAAAAAGGLAMILLGTHLISRAEARRLLLQSRAAEARLRQRETTLNNVIEHAPQGVATISRDRRIVDANPRLASMLCAPLPVLIGTLTDSFLPESYVARVFRSLSAAAEGIGDTYESDCQARRADGSQFWVHWNVTPIRKPDGTLDYFMAMFDDVTAKREAEETAVANLAQLEKLNRLKSEFVSMVSHEFRTALVGIQGFSELIRDQEMEVKEMKLLAEEIYNDSQRLNRMITEMLDFDRLEAGKLRLDLRPLDLNELVGAAVEHARVSTKKHRITERLEPGLPEVLGDADRLTQVLTNLLSNAIKYSPNGGDVCVSTCLSAGSVEVAVVDHGRGIPPEFINRLFGRYERYEDKHAGKIIGTGLGLAITRQIVEMHGGHVTVHSVVGEGSDFRFTLPLAANAATITRSA